MLTDDDLSLLATVARRAADGDPFARADMARYRGEVATALAQLVEARRLLERAWSTGLSVGIDNDIWRFLHPNE